MTSFEATRRLVLVGALALAGCTPGAEETEAPAEPAAAEAPAPEQEPAPVEQAQPAADDALPVEWIIWADGDPWDGPAPLEVEFECDLMEEVTEPSYEWDFGDASPKSNEANPKHVYTKPGRYTATCTVRDPSGGTGEDAVVIDVDPAGSAGAAAPEPPQAEEGDPES